ncbi:hypothetical protein DL95DRAFT_390762 [Leptodontidium sp. 2 PMI_412]|nr:hypothetical protein DL95DRAFT_390762 [Leptodontidium sp. 2 PMI_412]
MVFDGMFMTLVSLSFRIWGCLNLPVRAGCDEAAGHQVLSKSTGKGFCHCAKCGCASGGTFIQRRVKSCLHS